MSVRAATVRLLAVALMAAAALVASPAPAATPAEVKYGKALFAKVNDIRANNGRVRLTKNKCLQRFANRQARRMAKQQRMFHQDEVLVMNECGLTAYAENVAYGTVGPRSIVKGWMNSPDHKANILWRRVRITGVAARKSGGYWWAAQVFGRR